MAAAGLAELARAALRPDEAASGRPANAGGRVGSGRRADLATEERRADRGWLAGCSQ